MFEISLRNVSQAELWVDHELTPQACLNQWLIDPAGQSVQIVIRYQPGGEPLLRINNFLINFWLADIHHQDCCISFVLDQNFAKNYNKKDKQGRMHSLSHCSESVLDKTVGRFLHESLVNDIKRIIYEKRNIS